MSFTFNHNLGRYGNPTNSDFPDYRHTPAVCDWALRTCTILGIHNSPALIASCCVRCKTVRRCGGLQAGGGHFSDVGVLCRTFHGVDRPIDVSLAPGTYTPTALNWCSRGHRFDDLLDNSHKLLDIYYIQTLQNRQKAQLSRRRRTARLCVLVRFDSALHKLFTY